MFKSHLNMKVPNKLVTFSSRHILFYQDTNSRSSSSNKGYISIHKLTANTLLLYLISMLENIIILVIQYYFGSKILIVYRYNIVFLKKILNLLKLGKI